MAPHHLACGHGRSHIDRARVEYQPSFCNARGSDPRLGDRPGPDHEPAAGWPCDSRWWIHRWPGVLLDSLGNPSRDWTVVPEPAARRRGRTTTPDAARVV